MSRTTDKGSLLFLILAGCVLGLAAGCSRSRSTEPASLSCVELPRDDRLQQIEAGETHCYELNREVSQTIAGLLQPQGLTFLLTLHNPGGKEVWILDSLRSGKDPERFHAVAEEKGTYRLYLSPMSDSGTYRIRVDPPHLASYSEQLQGMAQRELGLGVRARLGANPADWKRSVGPFRKAQRLFDQAGDREEADKARFRLSLVYSELKEMDRAFELWNDLRPRWHGHPCETWLLNEIGLYFDDYRHDPETAITWLQEAVQVGLRSGNTEGEGLAHNNLGRIYAAQGDIGRAEPEYKEALERLAPGRSRDLAKVNYARLLAEAGRPEEGVAWSFGWRAPSAKTEIDRRRALAVSYQLKSSRQGPEAGKLRVRAFDEASEAVKLAKDLGDPEKRLDSLNDLATICFLQDRLDRAKPLFQEILQERQAPSDFVALGSALSHLGVIEAELHHGDAHLSYFPRARELFGLQRDEPSVAQVYYAEARALFALGRPEEALEEIQASIQRIERLRNSAQQNVQSLAYVEFRARQYELQIEILMELDLRYPGHGYDLQAFVASEQYRARVLLSELAGRASTVLDQQFLKPLQALAERVQALRARPAGLGLERELTLALADYRAEQDRLFRAQPRYRDLVSPKPPEVPEVQSWLDPDTRLVSYSVLRRQTFVWIIGPRTFEVRRLGLGRDELTKSIEAAAPAWKEAGGWSEKGRKSGEDKLRKLSLQLLTPLDGLTARRLIFIVTGPLQEVPFAALLTAEGSSDGIPPFLARDHEIGYLPSAAVFRELRRPRPAKVGRPLLAIFAVSEFPAETRLRPLPNARNEAEAIGRITRPLGRVVELYDDDAQIEALRTPDVEEARILHLATHAFASSDPSYSRIVLAGPGTGWLSASEIYQLRLRADLVTLSACETGVGQDVMGEGSISLTRGFFYAGAPRVLASLWKIEDKATFEMMPLFYHSLLVERRSPTAALQAAQLAMLRNGWTAPKYWAGVTLQGDWSPMHPTIP